MYWMRLLPEDRQLMEVDFNQLMWFAILTVNHTLMTTPYGRHGILVAVEVHVGILSPPGFALVRLIRHKFKDVPDREFLLVDEDNHVSISSSRNNGHRDT